MDTKTFKDYRDEIVAMLEKYGIDPLDAIRICAAAMNEMWQNQGYVASVSTFPIPNIVENPQAGTNLNIQLAGGLSSICEQPLDLAAFRQILAKEIAALEQAS